jgi:hypothetical protein
MVIKSFRSAGIIFASLVILFQLSCGRVIEGEGPVRSQQRQVESFHAIVISLPAKVFVKDSSVSTCLVQAEESLLEAIITRIDGKTLVITSKGVMRPTKPVQVFITSNRISKIEVNGSGQVQSAGTLKTDHADLELNGSGLLELDLVAVDISAGISGSGNLHLSGTCNDLSLEIKGSGMADASGLNALGVKVKVLGSGEAFVNASETLKAKVTGSGEVRYKGDAAVDKAISGTGDVRREEIKGS